MFDHVGSEVAAVQASKAFYDRALEPIGASVVLEYVGKAYGCGTDRKPVFWIGERAEAGAPVHVAFSAPDEAVCHRPEG